MRKRIIWTIIFTIFIILLVLVVKPIRTITIMENIAKGILMDEGPLKLFSYNYEPLYEGIEGPIITDRKERVEFTWYKVLEWGDTASVSAYVYKSFLKELLGIIRSKNPPSATANIKWNYVYVPEGISKFTDILQHKNLSRNFEASSLKIKNIQKTTADSIKFIVDPELLLFFLKNGHFQLVDNQEDYSMVDFYQPIAWISQKQSHSLFSTHSAKIFVNDSLEVMIIPYDTSNEISRTEE